MSTSAGFSLLSNAVGTSAVVQWPGGKATFAVKATWGGGNVALQMLLPDGATWAPVLTALTADGFSTVDLPPGSLRAVVTTATAVYARVDRVPS